MNERLGYVCGTHLAKKADDNSQIWVIDGDLADSEGAENFAAKHPDKFINAGIAEQNMVSVAAGIAATGARPWVFSFAAFLCYRAYDQIRVSITQTEMPVSLVGSHAGACNGKNGKTHVSLNDIALMTSLPKMTVWAPSDPEDVVKAVDSILQDNYASYMRLPRDPAQFFLPQGEGLVRWIGDPSKIAIISYGFSTQLALASQKMLKEQGFDIGILHFCKIWPLDANEIFNLLKFVKCAFVIEDHYGLHGFISCLKHIGIETTLISMGWPIDWCGQSGSTEDILQHFKLSPEQITLEILKKLR